LKPPRGGFVGAGVGAGVGFEAEDAVDVGYIVSLTDGWMALSMKSDVVKKKSRKREKDCYATTKRREFRVE
jgi:hypothetical protein